MSENVTDFAVGDAVRLTTSQPGLPSGALGEVQSVGNLALTVEFGTGERSFYKENFERAAHRFNIGEEVIVNEHPVHGSLAIGRTFPFTATVTGVDGYLPGAQDFGYGVADKGPDGSEAEWGVRESMLSPARATWYSNGVEYPPRTSASMNYFDGSVPENVTENPSREISEVQRLREKASTLQEKVDRDKVWLDTLVRDAHEMANQQDWCSSFDDFMEEHGLPRRTRYRVTATFTVEVETVVTADSDDAAEEKAALDSLTDDIENKIADLDLRAVSSVQFDQIDSAEEE